MCHFDFLSYACNFANINVNITSVCIRSYEILLPKLDHDEEIFTPYFLKVFYTVLTQL